MSLGFQLDPHVSGFHHQDVTITQSLSLGNHVGPVFKSPHTDCSFSAQLPRSPRKLIVSGLSSTSRIPSNQSSCLLPVPVSQPCYQLDGLQHLIIIFLGILLTVII